jgi:RNA polymerase sigma-70 factor, ECF subfamily
MTTRSKNVLELPQVRLPKYIRHVEKPENIYSTLICRALAGDITAIAQFFDSTVMRTWAVVAKIVHTETIAETVLVETYVQFWREARKNDYSAVDPLASLLLLARKRALLLVTPSLASETNTFVPLSVANNLLDDFRSNTTIHKRLAELSSVEQRILSAILWKGRGFVELSLEEGIPEQDIRTIVDGIVKKLIS